MKLSPTMQDALIAIERSGGSAIAEGGGWWKGLDDKRLEVFPRGDSLKSTVGTNTIYALEDRGLLERTFTKPSYRDTRILTAKGRVICAELKQET